MTLALAIDGFSIHNLDLVQRILVSTDGTLTETLASIFLERIELVKLAINITPTLHSFQPLEVKGGSNLMQRQVVLRGSKSGTPYAYAQVVIATDRLPERLRSDLLEGRVPLGELWILHRLEIFKEHPHARRRPAGDLAKYLAVSEKDSLIQRTYRSFTGGLPTFLVSEYFPAQYRWPPP
jgi:chorismate-pyruvate lyase